MDEEQKTFAPQQPEEQPAAPQPEEGADTVPIPEKKEERPGFGLFEWLQMCLCCILTAVLIFNCFARLSRVSGHSMDNTLAENEIMLVWSLGYTPKQGDVVVLNKTVSEFLGGPGGEAIVKRVIATGGQTVDIDYSTSTVYVDGEPLDEPYIKEPMLWPSDLYMQQTHWDIPEGSIFVMGDNRNGSTDSRHEWLGPIDEGYVLGRSVLALFPLSQIGPIR